MDQLIAISISAGAIFALVLVLGKKFRLSTKYERSPRQLNTWSAQDHGLDPSEETGNERS